MKKRSCSIKRKTQETEIFIELDVDGKGTPEISTGIPFFDHMLTLFTVHGFFDLSITAKGDIDVDFHHTVEDVGIVLGDAMDQAFGDRNGIRRYGYAVTPMDESLAAVAVDLSKRPFLVYSIPPVIQCKGTFDVYLAKEFFRAFSNHAGMNLHINVNYGENEHHIIEAIFKAAGRAISQAAMLDDRVSGVRSTKGML